MLFHLLNFPRFRYVREIAKKIERTCILRVWMGWNSMEFAGNRSFNVSVLPYFSIYGTFRVLDPLESSYKTKRTCLLVLHMQARHIQIWNAPNLINFAGKRSPELVMEKFSHFKLIKKGWVTRKLSSALRSLKLVCYSLVTAGRYKTECTPDRSMN